MLPNIWAKQISREIKATLKFADNFYEFYVPNYTKVERNTTGNIFRNNSFISLYTVGLYVFTFFFLYSRIRVSKLLITYCIANYMN